MGFGRVVPVAPRRGDNCADVSPLDLAKHAGVPVSAHEITYDYRRRGEDDVRVLEGLELELAAGERLAVTGRSGAGKSTLLALLGGLERPQAGRLQVGDVELAMAVASLPRSARSQRARAVLTVAAVALAAALLTSLLVAVGAARVPGTPLGIARPTARDRNPEPFRATLTGVDLRRVGELPVTVLAGVLPTPGAVHEVAVTDAYLRELGLRSTDSQRVLGTVVEIGAPRVFASAGGDVIVRDNLERDGDPFEVQLVLVVIIGRLHQVDGVRILVGTAPPGSASPESVAAFNAAVADATRAAGAELVDLAGARAADPECRAQQIADAFGQVFRRG